MRRGLVLLAVAGAVGLAGAAAALGARAAADRIRRSPDPVPRAELLRSPAGEQVVVERRDGTRLHVVVCGPPTGRTVVLAHGIALDLREWNLVVDGLVQRGWRTVAFDHRGHGRSTVGSDGVSVAAMAADQLAVLDAVGATHGILVGHSMGGFVALRGILDVPGTAQRLAGLVLAASFAGGLPVRAPQNLEAPILRSHLLARLSSSPTVGTLFAASFFGRGPSPAMLEALLAMVSARDLEPLLPVLEDFADDDMVGRMAAVALPTAVLCGSGDRITSPQEARRLLAGIPGSRAVWIPGAGHMLPWEAPAAIIEAIANLTASLDA